MAGDVARHEREIGRLVARSRPTRLDAGEIEQRIDKFQKTKGVTVRGIKPFALGVGQPSTRQGVLQRSEHRGEGRSKFVADVGKEQRLGAVDFSEGFSTLALRLVSARIRNRGAKMPCNELQRNFYSSNLRHISG